MRRGPAAGLGPLLGQGAQPGSYLVSQLQATRSGCRTHRAKQRCEATAALSGKGSHGGQVMSRRWKGQLPPNSTTNLRTYLIQVLDSTGVIHQGPWKQSIEMLLAMHRANGTAGIALPLLVNPTGLFGG